MEFLILWLGTIIASLGMEFANELRVFKDAADAGYKIDMDKFSEFDLNPNETNFAFLSMLIPIFNVMQVFQRTIQYNNARPVILDQLSVIDALEEMSEIEKAEYLKKPTGLNALVVTLKFEAKLKKAIIINIKDGDEYIEIYYELGESLDDINILKVVGPASRLTVEEQKQKVLEACVTVIEEKREKYGIIKTNSDTLEMSNNEDLNDSEEDKEEETTLEDLQRLGITKEKQVLENLKRELLEEKEQAQTTQKDKEQILSKRKK